MEDNKDKNKELKEKILLYGGLLIAIIMLANIVYTSIIKPIEDIATSHQSQIAEVIITTNEIQSVVINESIKGTFVLGIGTVSDRRYYVAYEVQEDGGLRLVQLDAEITTIYQTLTENETPYVEYYSNGYNTIKEIKLYVPENTIQQNYDLDL